MKKWIFSLLICLVAFASSVSAAPITTPDMGVTPGDVLQAGITEGGSVVGLGLAFAVGLLVLFFGFKMLKKVLKPA